MVELEIFSQITLYILLILFGIFTLLLGWFQFNVFKGKAMDNPDGSVDDWHEQKILFGMAVADLVIICPITLLGVLMILTNSNWGFYIIGAVSFWYVWVNSAFTITSLRFEKPKITINWFVVYPFGILIGISYLIWMIIHSNLLI